MIIKNMFVKDIDRDIKGVIKVGQAEEENIRQELDEYVVTRELEKHFRDFFTSYKRGITGKTDKGLSDLSQAGEYGIYSAYNLIKKHSIKKK